jgi:hypothetical protein
MEQRNFLERALRGPNQWWIYLMVLTVTIVGGGAIGLLPGAITAMLQRISGVDMGDSKDIFNLGMSILALFIILVFGVTLIGVFNHRTFSEIVNGTKSVRWNRIFFALAVSFVLAAIFEGIDYFWHSGNYVPQLNWGRFVVYFVINVVGIALLAILIELLIHGYLAQGIGAGTNSRWWALIIPAIIFTLLFESLHIRELDWLTVGDSLFLGLLLGLIAILDDGIELAIGLTVGEGFLSRFITSSEDPNVIFAVSDTYPVQDLISSIVIGLIAFFIFYKKYRWNFNIMNRKVGTKILEN